VTALFRLRRRALDVAEGDDSGGMFVDGLPRYIPILSDPSAPVKDMPMRSSLLLFPVSKQRDLDGTGFAHRRFTYSMLAG
jgi:hypothetical protein